MYQLYPYYKNFSKRIVKTPKLYFYDSGLLCHLLKITDEKQLQTHSLKGSLFENMMIAEYIKQMSHKNVVDDLWFWRDSSGNEVDFLIENDKGFRIVEFKASMTVMPDMFKGMEKFQQLSGWKDLNKALVYGGNDRQNRTAGKVVPWKEFEVE